MEIPRPGTRIEIVAAMRRRPVDITVSVDGVKVVLQRKKVEVLNFSLDMSYKYTAFTAKAKRPLMGRVKIACDVSPHL
ncbi:unnamed protein product [Strongylus vulgaris]|uniref:Uncharacterized protein n=1 Tax=Strongylus vulgaris TaxID=40348 RepID=A0A3P7JWU6_STRVU|nr:unnamed protein product [Strongylus vulgaris]